MLYAKMITKRASKEKGVVLILNTFELILVSAPGHRMVREPRKTVRVSIPEKKETVHGWCGTSLNWGVGC